MTWRRRLYLWLARKVCAREWHRIDFRPVRYPWDRSILGSLEMYCARCGAQLGGIGPSFQTDKEVDEICPLCSCSSPFHRMGCPRQ